MPGISVPAARLKPEGIDLRFRPFVAQNYRHLLDAQLLRRLQAQVAIDYLAVTASKNGNFDSVRVSVVNRKVVRGCRAQNSEDCEDSEMHGGFGGFIQSTR